MRKKCIAIAKKAMVWALAASMLVATPLTASAAGLRGVYSTTDGSGNTVGNTGDPSRTGTVTTTNSNTGVLTNEAKITGLSINPSAVSLELDGEPEEGKNQKMVTAKILGTVEGEELEKLESKLIWRVKNTDIATVDAKSDNRTEAKLTPWQGGDTVVEVTLDDYKKNIHFKAEAKVSVKEYTQDFSLAIPEDAKLYVNHTLDLNELIDGRNPATANDTFTFGIEPGVKGGATLNAANVVTFKKECDVKVVVVSEKGLAREITLSVKEGNKSKKVVLHKVVDGKVQEAEYKKETLDIATAANRTVVVKADLQTADNAPSTDTVTWTSNKGDIVEVESLSADTTEATLKLKKVGKATITAKASSGKSAKVALTVQATLHGLEIADIKVCEEKNTVYTGQTIQLEALRDPAENTDALSWSVDNKSIASVNAKGVLTIKDKVTYAEGEEYAEIAILVKSKKNSQIASLPLTIKVKQNKLTGFSVYEGSNEDNGRLLLTVGADGKQTVKGNKSTLNIPQNKTYTATAIGGPESTLNWTSSNAKVASVVKDNTGKAVITPLKKGNATITVSGVMEIPNKKADKPATLKLVKATFKVEVKQPVTTLTMNKSEVAVKNTGKKQNVSFSVKQNANPKETITWNVVQTKGEKAAFTFTQKGKVTLEKDGYKAGDEFEVTATATSGITTKATISVVDATNKVVIAKELDKDGKPVDYSYVNAKDKTVNKATTLPLGESIELTSYVDTTAHKDTWQKAGVNNTATVTYTANKKGVVQIVGNKVTRLTSGSVTITAKTSDGKSYKLKLDDPVVTAGK